MTYCILNHSSSLIFDLDLRMSTRRPLSIAESLCLINRENMITEHALRLIYFRGCFIQSYLRITVPKYLPLAFVFLDRSKCSVNPCHSWHGNYCVSICYNTINSGHMVPYYALSLSQLSVRQRHNFQTKTILKCIASAELTFPHH